MKNVFTKHKKFMVKYYISKTGNEINVCSNLPSALYTLLRIMNAQVL